MDPTFIYNSKVFEAELRQYLANLGVKDILIQLQGLRRNPDDKAIENHKKSLLTIMLKQARGLGWDLPASWEPFKGLFTLPDVLTRLSVSQILKLIQNQAKLLLKIAPRSECHCEDRTVFVPMTISQNWKGEFFWTLPRRYDEWTRKKKERFYVYDATGKKRYIKHISVKKGKKVTKQPDCSPRAVPLKIKDLKQNFLSAEFDWPVPFLPKAWYEDYVPEDDPWLKTREELERIFPGGFLKISEPRAVEVIATEEPPTLQDVDTSLDLSPDLLSSKLPNGDDAPPELELTPTKDEPFEWQGLALERWTEQENTIELADGSLRTWVGGIVEACTGAGKTKFCYDAMVWVLERHPDTRISIIVPKKVLLEQWYEEVEEVFGDRVDGVSRHSADYDEPAAQISIWVIHSASKELPIIDLQQPHLKKYPYHFLIVDEVHRSTSRHFRQIYDFSGSDYESSSFLHPEFRLGVTATLPAGSESNVKKFELLVRHLGPVLCQYKYAHAIMKGNISPFRLIFLETGLTPGELLAYEALSEKVIKQMRFASALEKRGQLYPEGYDDMTADEKEEYGEPLPIKMMQFLGGARARIDWAAANRLACAVDLIRTKAAEGKKIIVFHKSIDGATAIYNLLHLGLSYGDPVEPVAVGLYHSQNPEGVNEKFLDAFRRWPDESGPRIQVLVSVQSLFEGLNVPDADVGVAVAADKSQIKAVQSLGRVLRIKPGSDELKEYYLITVKNREGRGDNIVKSKFLSSLRDKDGEFISDIPEPETVPCWPANPPTEEEVEELHEKAGLMSYTKIREMTMKVVDDESLLTRSQLIKAFIAHGKEDFRDEDEDSKDEENEIVRPEPVWPGWLKVPKKPKQLPPPPPPESPPKSTPWRHNPPRPHAADIGEQIYQLRRSLGLSRIDLAKLIILIEQAPEYWASKWRKKPRKSNRSHVMSYLQSLPTQIRRWEKGITHVGSATTLQVLKAIALEYDKPFGVPIKWLTGGSRSRLKSYDVDEAGYLTAGKYQPLHYADLPYLQHPFNS